MTFEPLYDKAIKAKKRSHLIVMFSYNLVPRAHVPFGQHQDTELWNNPLPETKILGLLASRRMRGLVYMASRDKVDVDTFHKGIQYALERLGKSKFGFESTTVSNSKSAAKTREVEIWL